MTLLVPLFTVITIIVISDKVLWMGEVGEEGKAECSLGE